MKNHMGACIAPSAGESMESEGKPGMNVRNLRELLDGVRRGDTPVEAALERLRALPFDDMGHTKLDLHRELRRGHPEAIYCAGKTAGQVVEIARRMAGAGQNVLMTRLTPEQRAALQAAFPGEPIDYNELARTAFWLCNPIVQKNGIVAVACAGTSDIPVAEEAAVTARAYGSKVETFYDCGVAGIHRLLAVRELLDRARVIVVVAGMEGALASAVAGLMRAPIIAVPTSIGYGASFGGLAALLSMLNSCSPGVAVVNIDNGYGAGLMADMINTLGEASSPSSPSSASAASSASSGSASSPAP